MSSENYEIVIKFEEIKINGKIHTRFMGSGCTKKDVPMIEFLGLLELFKLDLVKQLGDKCIS